LQEGDPAAPVSGESKSVWRSRRVLAGSALVLALAGVGTALALAGVFGTEHKKTVDPAVAARQRAAVRLAALRKAALLHYMTACEPVTASLLPSALS
jgi:hypothetical protein